MCHMAANELELSIRTDRVSKIFTMYCIQPFIMSLLYQQIFRYRITFRSANGEKNNEIATTEAKTVIKSTPTDWWISVELLSKNDVEKKQI